MIWTDSPCWITCWNDSNSYIKALRSPKIEFILAQHPWLENDCLFADIILPVNTKFEEQDIDMDIMSERCDLIYHEGKCIEPIGESRSDYEIVCLIAEKLGLLKEYTEGRSVEDWIKFGFDNSGAAPIHQLGRIEKTGIFRHPDRSRVNGIESQPQVIYAGVLREPREISGEDPIRQDRVLLPEAGQVLPG